MTQTETGIQEYTFLIMASHSSRLLCATILWNWIQLQQRL